MDGKKSARSKSGTKQSSAKKQQEDISSVSEDEKTFVDKMKKRAIVKTYGIDNVSKLLLFSIKLISFRQFNLYKHMS